MSRVIKTFSYSKYLESLGETDVSLSLKADQVETLKLPKIVSNDSSLSSSSVKIKMYAKEDEKGVFVFLAELKDDKETGKVSETIVVDEEKFADALFSAVETGVMLDKSDYLSEILSSEALVSFGSNCLGPLGGHFS